MIYYINIQLYFVRKTGGGGYPDDDLKKKKIDTFYKIERYFSVYHELKHKCNKTYFPKHMNQNHNMYSSLINPVEEHQSTKHVDCSYPRPIKEQPNLLNGIGFGEINYI